MATEASDSKVPDWVQAEIFTDVLKESVDGFSKIKSFKAAGGSAAGENYATIMLRVNIEVELKDGKEKSVSYMLKLPHQSEIFQAMMKRNNIFEAERTVYKTIVPEMEQLYRDAGVEVKFGAKSYREYRNGGRNLFLYSLSKHESTYQNKNRKTNIASMIDSLIL